MTTHIPPQLKQWLIDSGRWNNDGISRRATAGYCRRCDALVLRGLDSDVGGIPTTCDPAALSRPGEVAALLLGRHTFELRWAGSRGYAIDGPRYAARITARPAATTPGVDVLAEHACGSTLPTADSRLPPPPPPLPIDPPF